MIHKKDHASWPNAVPPRTQVSCNIWISISVTHHTANVKRKTQPLRLPSSLSTFSPPLPSSSSSRSLFSLAGTPSRFQVLQYSIAYSHAVHQLSKTHSPCIIGTLNSLIDIFIPPTLPAPDILSSAYQFDYFRFFMWEHAVFIFLCLPYFT